MVGNVWMGLMSEPSCLKVQHSLTLSVDDVNENINDNDGACSPDSCTGETKETIRCHFHNGHTAILLKFQVEFWACAPEDCYANNKLHL